ncbi:MAG TPA: SIMPL domain-containing protein [Pseudolabrys sp.]|nr:SIMPL domain-containing protein [Pseudolabrys sp.]
MRALVLLIATLALALPAQAQQDANFDVITVTGQAETSATPDVASLHAGVTSQGKSAQEASDTNNREMAAVLAALKDAGIAEKDVQTARISLQPLYDTSASSANRGGKQRVIGFQASNQVTVMIRDIAKLATVIDRAIGAGANEINGIQFIVSNPSKALDEARGAAIADAKRKAELYAQAAGVRLGHPVMITEDGASPPPVFMGKAMAARAPIPIAVGEQTLHAAVTVSFQLMH